MALSDGLNIFGFQIKKASKKENWSIVPPVSDDGSTIGNSSNSYYGMALDLEGSIKNDNDLIRRYREISNYSDCDSAIEEIVNEAIVADSNKLAISIELDELPVPPKIKDIVVQEFNTVLRLFDFEEKGHDLFRQWYIDGRMFHNIILDPNPQNGISELRYIDPRKIRKIKNITKERDPKTGFDVITNIEEYYLFNDKGITEQTAAGIKMSIDSVLMCTSGLLDYNTGLVLSYLHDAIKPCNQLKVMEDALVIYRITRSTERRVFYIDVGNLPKLKAEQHIQEQMNMYRNKITYEVTTGEIKDARNHLSMTEDFWLGRRGDGKSTEITTLPGGCFAMDTKVSLLDGRELSIKEIEEEMKLGKELWTYSCDEYTGEIKPGLISWAGVTHKSAKVMKLTLDNGEEIICTPDHEFPIYGKGFVKAKDFEEGESLIPLYRKKEFINTNAKLDYEMIFDNHSKQWNYTHRMIRNNIDLPIFEYNQDYNDGYVIHHVNTDRYNNDPNNLCIMSFKDHTQLHASIGFPPMLGTIASKEKIQKEKALNSDWYQNLRSVQSKNSVAFWESLTEENRIVHCNKIQRGVQTYIDNLSPEDRKIRDEIGRVNIQAAKQQWIHLMNTDPTFREKISNIRKNSWTKERRLASAKRLSHRSKLMWADPEYQANHTENQEVAFDNYILCKIIDLVKGKTTHQVNKTHILDCLNNDTICREHLTNLNQHKHVPNWNPSIGFTKPMLYKCVTRFGGYDSWVDFRRKESLHNHRIINIEYLPDEIEVGTLTIDQHETIHNHHTFALSCGVFTKNSNLSEISDITYFQTKLYQALRVPIARLQPQQGFSLGRSTEVTRDEIKFNKFIERLRRKFASLFRDALRIQLVVKGIIRDDEWDTVAPYIRFNYQKDNHFAELKDSEIMQQRVSLLNMIQPYVGIYYSMNWVNENILMLTEQDREIMSAEMQQEQKLMAQLQPQPQQGETP